MAPTHRPGDHGNDPSANDAAPEYMLHPRRGRGHTHLREGVQRSRLKSLGPRSEQCEQKRAGDVRRKDDGPEPQRSPEMAPLVEDERNRIESVFREELCPAED